MELSELYRLKGELTTTIEVSQAKLREINQQIVNALNSEPKAKEKKDKKAE